MRTSDLQKTKRQTNMNFRHALLLILLLFTIELFGQEKIDDNVSVTFPKKPETKEFSENIGSLKANLKALLSFRSGSQWNLYL